MTTREAALYLGISVFYLRNLRHLLYNYDGPAYTGDSRTGYQYSKRACDTWSREHTWRPLRSRVSKAA